MMALERTGKELNVLTYCYCLGWLLLQKYAITILFPTIYPCLSKSKVNHSSREGSFSAGLLLLRYRAKGASAAR
jgi:hypothetical protein